MANRSQRLFDVITRQQIYIEGLKEQQTRLADTAFRVMETEIHAAINGLQVENVGDLTQAQLRKLLKQLRDIQNDFYSAAVRRLIAFIADWLVYEVKETPALLADSSNPIVPIGSASSLWASISKETMGATGGDIMALLAGLAPYAVRDLSNRVRAGVADNMKLREFTASIVGTESLNRRDGVFTRHQSAIRAAYNTSLQQVITQLRDKAYELITDRYMWNSVIDGATTDVCRGRNGRTFLRGKGPLPPAHYNCRSSTVPIFLRETITIPPNYYRWLTSQPEPFVRDILPRRLHEVLRRNELRASDLPKFSEPAPLTLEQYKAKSNYIRTGTDG